MDERLAGTDTDGATDHLQALARACSMKRPRDLERINEGETLWLYGRAAPADDGTLALSQGDLTIVVRKDDVRGSKRCGDGFSIGIGANANATFRIERTVRLGDVQQNAADACPDCAGAGNTAVFNQRPEPKGGLGFGSPITLCKVGKLCITILGRNYCIDWPYDCVSWEVDWDR